MAGWQGLASLAQIMVAFYITCLIFVVVILGLLLRAITGVGLFSLLRLPGSGIPADPVHLLIGVRTAPG